MKSQEARETEIRTNIREKIRHILSTYPQISPSHLQLSLGSSLPTSYWQPILEAMIDEKVVQRTSKVVTAPNGRTSSVTLLSLTPSDQSHLLTNLTPTP